MKPWQGIVTGGGGHRAPPEPPHGTPQLLPVGTLQPTARRVCRETTVATTAKAVARPSVRTSGQKVMANTDAESSAATASSSHCSQAAGISHSTCGGTVARHPLPVSHPHPERQGDPRASPRWGRRQRGSSRRRRQSPGSCRHRGRSSAATAGTPRAPMAPARHSSR